MSKQNEATIALLCQSIWGESDQNNVCGLIEEAMEVVAQSRVLTEEQAIAVATAAIKRAFRDPNVMIGDPRTYSENQNRLQVTNELSDLYIMSCVVRAKLGSMVGDSLTDRAVTEMVCAASTYFDDEAALQKSRAKLSIKREQGIRL